MIGVHPSTKCRRLRVGRVARVCVLLLGLALVPLTAAATSGAVTDADPLVERGAATRMLLAQADEDASEASAAEGRLEPRYQPREPEPKSWYNSSYLFGMTRGVANSTMVPAAKLPLFVLTVPLDIAFLPFAAIGGLFG
jgi:hypothetical protein